MSSHLKNIFSKLSLRTFLSGSKKFFGITEFFRHSQFLHLHIHLLFIFLFLSFSCNTNEPPPDTGAITLSVEDASCIEAWINLKAENISLPVSVTLKQTENNGEEKVRQVINLTTADTVLYVDSLLPKRSYKFKAEWINSAAKLKTAEATVVTMDTTSHNFTFETFTFGQHSSSVLYDVAIINENNIWAVGEIYMNDSLGNPDPHAYNAVHWDGSEWNLKKLTFYSFCPQGTGSGSYPARSIFAFDNENIVVSSGSQVAYLKNGVQIKKECVPVSINKIWGVSVDDFYIVGYGGGIAHWDGSSWKKIESPIGTGGTGLSINDVWGDYNKQAKEWEILAVASNKFFNEGSTVLKIGNISANELNKTGLPWSLSSIWFQSSKNYFIGGDGLFSNKIINDNWKKVTDFPTFYKDRIRGVDSNDIVVSGSNGLLSHFNGYSWHHYLNNELPYFSGRLLSIELKNNIIVSTGWNGQNATIIFGKR